MHDFAVTYLATNPGLPAAELHKDPDVVLKQTKRVDVAMSTTSWTFSTYTIPLAVG